MKKEKTAGAPAKAEITEKRTDAREASAGRKTSSESGCPYARHCGGCQLRNMDYARQSAYKEAQLIKRLGRFGHVSPLITAEQPLYYRHKVHAVFGTKNGHVISGNYRPFSHQLIPVESCRTDDGGADAIIASVRRIAEELRLPIFDDERLSGFLRHIVIRKSHADGTYLVVLVTGTKVFPRREEFLGRLLAAHPEIVSVVQNVNAEYTSKVLGREFFTLSGDGAIEDSLCGCRFRISAASFYQVNPVMAEKLYRKIAELLQLKGGETVLDAYCGTGTIGITLAKQLAACEGAQSGKGRPGRVLGVELNETAVRDARANAALNGLNNIEFTAADAGAYLTDMAARREKPDVLVLDPPRSGSTPQFLKSALKAGPAKLVYVSCNPVTLERDLGMLTAGGYKVRCIQPVDMFPQTEGLEVLTLLER